LAKNGAGELVRDSMIFDGLVMFFVKTWGF